MIFLALAAPIPGNSSNCSSVAVFKSAAAAAFVSAAWDGRCMSVDRKAVATTTSARVRQMHEDFMTTFPSEKQIRMETEKNDCGALTPRRSWERVASTLTTRL